MYLLSLFSSSFIEEEHQIWYILDITQLYLLFILNSNLRKIIKIKNVISIMFIMGATRLARSINQTGNKWIHLKDFGDTLREQESKVALTFLACLSLMFIFLFKWQKHRQINYSSNLLSLLLSTFDLFVLTLIGFYHYIASYELYSLADRNFYAQMCSLVMLIGLVINLTIIAAKLDFSSEIVHLVDTIEDDISLSDKYSLENGMDHNLAHSLRRVIKFKLIVEKLCNYFIYLICLLQPTHNLVLLLLWQLKEHYLDKLIFSLSLVNVKFSYSAKLDDNQLDSNTRHKLTLVELFFFLTIISQACFFTQGNSNSLNTVQISSGFVGVNHYSAPLVGSLIFIATYSSNLFWFLFLLKHLANAKLKQLILNSVGSRSIALSNQSKSEIEKLTSDAFNRLVNLRLVCLLFITFVYTLSSYLQRHHLFVWSVFAPKLIYQLFNYALESLLIVLFRLALKFII